MAATAWQLGVQLELNALGKIAVLRNKTLTYTIPEGEYDFETLSVPAHVSLIGGSGSTRSVRLRYVGGGDQTLLSMRGYGSRIQGFEIISKNQVAPRVTALKTESAKNSEISRIRVDLRGPDCIGVDIAGQESVKLEAVDLRCSNPIFYRWGDNVVLRDCDLGASGNCRNLINTVIMIAGMPHQVTFDGYQTWQRGKYAIFGEVSAAYSGQGLNLYNFRYEQSESKDDPDVAAIHLKFLNAHLENLFIAGSRWTDRKKGFETQNILKIVQYGSMLFGGAP